MQHPIFIEDVFTERQQTLVTKLRWLTYVTEPVRVDNFAEVLSCTAHLMSKYIAEDITGSETNTP